MKVDIYDPAMCCSSGICGPAIDPVLLKINEAVLSLHKQGVKVTRFNLAQQPREFMNNQTVAGILHKQGKKSLPITLVNDVVLKTSKYPTYEELCETLGIKPLLEGRPIPLM